MMRFSRRFATLVSSSPDHIVLTPNCVSRLLKVTELKPTKYLRLAVQGGGCSGFSYVFSLEKGPNDDDIVVERQGARVVVDEGSMSLVRGSTVDFVEDMKSRSFQVTVNPNADFTCSCGTSFGLKV
ncbi:mitochondrial iron-sulfur cluster biosynthesis IscA2 [Andalucia godoyi]|uniref:Mitochondrial iron-sulfur cluster biosynthesis IscA2 n=1 Tax=Andalucia godoyi TaxID=505711 RepID=A0A8K0AJT8_ANDGO|nr:mitochondrial iron-sulfur cluster biosynthesis IscA2 [Andalucia godoyi]|eukprot:ANDGO_07792.mRNA.2 mitochondrial iron-sulfur cluster biosynthesis IscA2